VNTLTLPEGFIARSATLDDAEIAADLFKTYSLAVAGDDDLNAEETRNNWQAPGFKLITDTLLVFTSDGQLAAYVEAWVNSKLPVHPYIWACVHPDFMKKGLGTYITAWGEERCHQVLDILPADLRLAPRVGAFSTNQPAHQLFKELSWTHIRSYYTMRIDMVSAPPAPMWLDGIKLRPYTSENLRAVYSAHREAFRDHFGHVEEPFEDALEHFKHNLEGHPQYDPSLWFIAWDGNEIAGYCLCRSVSPSDHEAGYINILGVRRPWRKHGLGLALLQQAFGEFHRRGQMHVELGVDADSLTGALRLYEKAGMYIHRQNDMFEKELRPGRELAVESL